MLTQVWVTGRSPQRGTPGEVQTVKYRAACRVTSWGTILFGVYLMMLPMSWTDVMTVNGMCLRSSSDMCLESWAKSRNSSVSAIGFQAEIRIDLPNIIEKRYSRENSLGPAVQIYCTSKNWGIISVHLKGLETQYRPIVSPKVSFIFVSSNYSWQHICISPTVLSMQEKKWNIEEFYLSEYNAV
jgi:hypothetical protein